MYILALVLPDLNIFSTNRTFGANLQVPVLRSDVLTRRIDVIKNPLQFDRGMQKNMAMLYW